MICRQRNASTSVSSSTQIRETSDFDIPSRPSASRRSSTLRVEAVHLVLLHNCVQRTLRFALTRFSTPRGGETARLRQPRLTRRKPLNCGAFPRSWFRDVNSA